MSVAIGLYVFCLEHGKSLKPWYIGKTSGKAGFKGEVFQNHKSDHYASLKAKRGKASIYFFPLRTNTGKISGNTSGAAKSVEWAEKRLITYALDRNADLLNTKDTKMHKSVFMPGVIGTQPKGKPGPEAKAARRIFSL